MTITQTGYVLTSSTFLFVIFCYFTRLSKTFILKDCFTNKINLKKKVFHKDFQKSRIPYVSFILHKSTTSLKSEQCILFKMNIQLTARVGFSCLELSLELYNFLFFLNHLITQTGQQWPSGWQAADGGSHLSMEEGDKLSDSLSCSPVLS